jgi:predicted MFS family arabinose efflux permease
VAHAVGVLSFYGASGYALIPAWTLMMVGFMACDVLFGALGTELFPTGHRATASGVRMMALAAGGALGLWMEGAVYAQAGSHATAIVGLALAAAPVPLLALLALPETARRELEDISPQGETS